MRVAEQYISTGFLLDAVTNNTPGRGRRPLQRRLIFKSSHRQQSLMPILYWDHDISIHRFRSLALFMFYT